MIRRNPDVLAIAFLLFGFGVYSAAQQVRACRAIPQPRLALTHTVCRTIPRLPSFRIVELTRF